MSVIELAPLSSQACAQYLRDRIPETPALEFTDAGEQATGGNPFLLSEFCLTVNALEVGLDAAGAEAAARLTSDRAGRSVLLRIGRLPPAADALARAVALFPDGAEFRHVAALAELSPEDAAGAADMLTDAAVLVAGRPLAFAHPIIRTAVYKGIPEAERAAAHARAADLLLGEDGHNAGAVPHLLATEPAGRERYVEALVAAGGEALGAGAVTAAIRYLRRALAEPPPPGPVRAGVLALLGNAEFLAGEPEATDRLRAALTVTDTAESRLQIEHTLGRVLGMHGRVDEAYDVLQTAYETTSDPADRLGLLAEILWIVYHDAAHPERYEQALVAIPPDLAGEDPTERALLCHLAERATRMAMPYETALALARRGLGGGALAASGIRYAPAGSIAISTLRAGDALAEGIEEAGRWIEAGRHEGFVVGLPMAHATAAAIRQVAGDLSGAEADARIGLRLAEGTPPGHATRIWSTAELLGTLVLQGKLDEAELLAPPGDAEVFSSFHARLFRARALLHLLRGRLEQALADITMVRRWCEARGIAGPHGEVPWRGITGAVLRRQSNEDEARQLAADDLDDAHRFGAPGAVGAAFTPGAWSRPGTKAPSCCVPRPRCSPAASRGSPSPPRYSITAPRCGAASTRPTRANPCARHSTSRIAAAPTGSPTMRGSSCRPPAPGRGAAS